MRILIGVLLLCAAANTFGQTLPIKEGLWENTVLDDDGSVAMRSLSCITQKSIADMIVKANNHPGCAVSGQNEPATALLSTSPAVGPGFRRAHTV